MRKSACAVAIGVKRTWLFALHMFAYDSKRTCSESFQLDHLIGKSDDHTDKEAARWGGLLHS